MVCLVWLLLLVCVFVGWIVIGSDVFRVLCVFVLVLVCVRVVCVALCLLLLFEVAACVWLFLWLPYDRGCLLFVLLCLFVCCCFVLVLCL